MDYSHLSNQHILGEIGDRFIAARMNIDITQDELAVLAGVSKKTVSNLENATKSVGLANVIAILRALDLLDQLDSFMPKPPPRAASLIVHNNKVKSERRRASNASTPGPEKDELWEWGDGE